MRIGWKMNESSRWMKFQENPIMIVKLILSQIMVFYKPIYLVTTLPSWCLLWCERNLQRYLREKKDVFKELKVWVEKKEKLHFTN